MLDLKQQFRVADWTVEPWHNRIQRTGTQPRPIVRHIEPRAMQVLLRLAEDAGKTVPTSTILESVWAGTFVEETTVRRAISQLRKAFDDSATNPTVIATVPKTGYRLIAEVSSFEKVAPRKIRRFSFTQIAIGVALATLLGVLVQTDPGDEAFLDARILTNSASLESNPSFSPDAKLVAFERTVEKADSKTSSWQVILKSTVSGEESALTDDEGVYRNPVWSPSGDRVAMIHLDGSKCSLQVIDVGSKQATDLADCFIPNVGVAWAPGLTWSSRGNWLAMPDRVSANSEYAIVLLDATNGSKKQLTYPDNRTAWDEQPVFSPDGSEIAFVRSSSSGRKDIHVVDIETAETRQITFDGNSIAGLDWSKHRNRIVFSSNRGGRFGLWSASPSGNDVTWVPDFGIVDPGGISVSAKGNSFVYENWRVNVDVWAAALDSSRQIVETRKLIATSQQESFPSVSTAGEVENIAFVSNRSGSNEIWMSDTSGKSPKQITDISSARTWSPRLSSDGSLVAFSATGDDGRTNIKIADAESGNVRTLDQPSESNSRVFPAWSDDNTAIFYADDRNGAWEIWKRSLDSGDDEQVTLNGGYVSQQVSTAEGDFLYYTKFARPGLFRKRLHASGVMEDEVIAIPGIVYSNRANWTVTSSGIYYFERVAGATRIMHHDLSTGKSIAISDAESGLDAFDLGIAVSRDEKALYFSRVQQKDVDLVIVEARDRQSAIF